MKKSVLTRYRVLAYVTGVLLVLLTLGMIGKYVLRAWSLGGRPAGPSTGDTAQGGIRS